MQVVLDDEAHPRLEIPGLRHKSTDGSVIRAVAELPSDETLAPLRSLPGVRRVEVFPMTLEEVFVELVGSSPGDPDRVPCAEEVIS